MKQQTPSTRRSTQSAPSRADRRDRLQALKRWAYIALAIVLLPLVWVQHSAKWQIAAAGAAVDPHAGSTGSSYGDLSPLLLQSALPDDVVAAIFEAPDSGVEPDLLGTTLHEYPPLDLPAPTSGIVAENPPATPLLTVTSTVPVLSEPPPEKRWQGIVLKRFGTEHYEDAVAIVMCESNGDPNAHGDAHLPEATDGLGSWGLFQINAGNIYRTPAPVLSDWQTDDGTEAVATLIDPEVNTEIAWLLFEDSAHEWGQHWFNCAAKLGLS